MLGYNPVRHHTNTFLYVKCLDCGYFLPVKEKATRSRVVPDEMDWQARYELLAEAAGLAPGKKRPRQKAFKERERAKRLMKGRDKRVADH